MKQSRLWSSLGTHGSLVVIWWWYISSSGETWKFDFLSQIWPWSSRSIAPQNNRVLNQGILQLWSKFGGPSLNGWGVIARTSSKWGKFWFEVKFDHEGQGQSPPKTIGILNKIFYTSAPNLVILAWMGDKLSRGQSCKCHLQVVSHLVQCVNTLSTWDKIMCKYSLSMVLAMPKCQQLFDNWLIHCVNHIFWLWS